MSEIEIKRSRSGVIVIVSMLLILLVLVLSTVESDDLPSWVSAICLASAPLVWMMLVQINIRFSTDGIVYPRLFGTKLIPWESIDRVDRRPGAIGIFSEGHRSILVLSFFPDREALISLLRERLPQVVGAETLKS